MTMPSATDSPHCECYAIIYDILWKIREQHYPTDVYGMKYCSKCGDTVSDENFAVRFTDKTKSYCDACELVERY